MARYDFECTICGNLDELDVPISESDCEQICSKCGSPSKKIMSAPGFILKGGVGGFHSKDYPKTGQK